MSAADGLTLVLLFGIALGYVIRWVQDALTKEDNTTIPFDKEGKP